jgi:type I restriction enzyme M protein
MRPNLTGLFPNPNKPAARQGRILFINADAEYHAGRAQNYLRPEYIEKIAATFERYEDVPAYARRVVLEEITDPANDFNLNIRRYVDNSPPPEPHDVRAHLIGGVPTTEIESKRSLYDALAFDPNRAFAARNGDARYQDFTPALTDRRAIRRLVEDDPSVQARAKTLRDALAGWWDAYAPCVAQLPTNRNLNTVRREFLETFTHALLPLGVLDRFKLAGVVASWWTDTLPDFKTLLENGFPGVIDGWIDAITDAVEDEENVGLSVDPFAHKLVRHAMPDYLQQMNDAKAEIVRLKGEKEVFEQSNPPDDADEEELEGWNYAKDLERQTRELKAEYRDELKDLARLERAAVKKKATAADHSAAEQARAKLRPTLQRFDGLLAELVPYEKIKTDLAAARRRYRELSDAFVEELKKRCSDLEPTARQSLVLELFAQDVQAGLDAAGYAKRESLSQFLVGVWDKYARTLCEIVAGRDQLSSAVSAIVKELGYVG